MDAIYKTEFEHHSVKAIIVALNRWFGSGKMPVKYFDTFVGYYDFCIDEPYVDARVHLDGCPSHYYNGSTWDSNVDCPNRPKNAAYAAIEYLREEHGIFYSPQMEPDNDHKTKGELKEQVRADYWFKTARERLTEIEKLRKVIKQQTKDDTDYILTAFREILDALGIDKSNYVHMDIPSLTRFAIMEAEKAASNLDNYRGGAMKFAADYSALQKEKERLENTVATSKAINDARYERMHDLITKISKTYWKTINPGPHDAIASTAERQLDVIESYISELRTHNEALQKDVNRWIAKANDLRIRCNSVFGKYGFVTKSKINDLCDEYDIMRPRDDEDCEESLRYILDILKEYRDKAVDAEDRARGAGQAYRLICDICDKYEIKKPSSNLTLEESIDDILKRFKMTLKENQDFRYEAERLYVNMTDLQPSYRMTILDILNAIAEDVDDREEAYCCLEAKWDTAEKLRKDWVKRYESEHERANGEHKRADKYWAQVAGLQTRIKNLEDALNRSASNSTGYEALKNTLRRTLDSEVRFKNERDSLAEELKRAKDAIRKQNEAILRKERLDEPSDNCDSEE